MKIAFFANPEGIHDCKWINKIAENATCILIANSNANLDNVGVSKSIPIFPIIPNTVPLLDRKKFKIVKGQIADLLKSHKIDICHSMYAYPYSIWPMEINFQKHIITTRGSDILIDLDITLKSGNNLKEKIAHKFLRRKMLKALESASNITCTSSKQANRVKSYISNQNKCEVLYTGLDIKKLSDYFTSAQRKNQERYIFSPRSMAALYNIELIVEAFHLFLKEHPQFKLKLINNNGNSAYYRKIHELTNSLQISDKIDWIEKVNLSEMVSLYKNAACTVMTPHSDGTPNSAIESMFCETPVILGALDYDSKLFNDNTCIRLQENSVNSLYLAMKESVDISKTDHLVKNAKSVVTINADLQSSIDRIMKIYQNL